MSSEEHEEIPWSMLVDREQRGRSRALYIGAALIMAAVIGFTGVRWINDHRHGEAAPVPDSVAVSTTLPAPPTTVALLSEADLMAIDPASATMAATARAEWFVTDYFTVDGSPAPDLVTVFVGDAALPELPQSTDDAVSFVEWARAHSVRPSPDGLIVTVLFRTLLRNGEQPLERSPVRAVDVTVVVEDERTAIGALPLPVPVPSARVLDGWTGGTDHEYLEDPSGLSFPVAAP